MKVDGRRIRALRLESRRTLQEVAEDADLSTGFLSQIERGLSEPSVDSVLRIAGALNVAANALVIDEEAQQGRVNQHFSGTYWDRFVTPESAKTIQVIESSLEPSGQWRAHAYAHLGDEECVFVIEGVLELTVGETAHSLGAGESLLFDPRVRHSYTNPGTDLVRWLWISAKSPSA
jgi:transcriptional regulator with XRE-family HTH domain